MSAFRTCKDIYPEEEILLTCFKNLVDSILHPRPLEMETQASPDQYVKGQSAKLWEVYIGEKQDRTDHYRDFLIQLLREHKIDHVLDVACGTGIDSVLLLEEGFKVMSVDASDKMLQYAMKRRWNRRKESTFDKWVIEKANWLTLPDDIHKPDEGFDAVICLGNSFAELFDLKGDASDLKLSIRNFHEMLKPGGYLLIDHRNYDYALSNGHIPSHSIYYNSKHIKDTQTYILYRGNVPVMVFVDKIFDISDIVGKFDDTDSEFSKKGRYHGDSVNLLRMSSYPHKLESFTELLKEVFGNSAVYKVFGDFKPLDKVKDPLYYIHFIQKCYSEIQRSSNGVDTSFADEDEYNN